MTKEEILRSPKIVKTIRLESYEDALNNLQLHRDKSQGELITKHPEPQGRLHTPLYAQCRKRRKHIAS